MPIAVDIFSGFLGAGKTMLIKKLISEEVYEKELAIIENEFGEVAIDGAFLGESCMKVKEIYSGCICCSVSGDFKKAILDVIHSYKVKRMIIEPSGVASLSDVLKVFKESEFQELLRVDRIITVVDATRFEIYKNNFGSFYKNQIQYAKTIVLSRTQFQQKEKLEEIIKEIKKINHAAAIVTTPWAELEGKKIAEASGENLKEELIRKLSKNKRSIKQVALQSGNISAQEVFDSFGIDTLEILNENRLRDILSKLNNAEKYGEVLRAKGILCAAKGKWLQFDYVPLEVDIRETKPYYTGKLCVIGTKLNKKALADLFKG